MRIAPKIRFAAEAGSVAEFFLAAFADGVVEIRALFRQIGEQFEFGGVHRTEGTARQIAQADRAEADSLQPHDLVIDTRHQSANLAVLTFVEDDVEIRTFANNFFHPHTLDRESAFVEIHASFERRQRFGRRHPFDVAEVKLRHAVSRVSQPVGQFAVVRDQQQAFRFFVEPADREQPLFELREQVENSRAASRIEVGANDAARLVQHEIHFAMLLEPFAIEFDLLRVRIGAKGQIGNDFAIDGDSAGGNELFALATRVDTSRGENFRQPLRSELRGRGRFTRAFDFGGRRIAVAVVIAVITDAVIVERNLLLEFRVTLLVFAATGGDAWSTAFNGTTLASGSYVIAYQAATIPAGSQCVYQPRSCNNGTLSGSYQFSSCVTLPDSNMSCVPDPGSPQTQTLSCPTGQTGFITQMRTSSCPGPAWSGWTTSGNTCVTAGGQSSSQASCSWNGQTIASGGSVTGVSFP